MSNNILSNLEPKSVFNYFEQICSIPHGSRNTKQISDFCVSFAKEHNLKYVQDESNNIIIWKDGTKGYENSPSVIIQGHLDMVCERKKSVFFKSHLEKTDFPLSLMGTIFMPTAQPSAVMMVLLSLLHLQYSIQQIFLILLSRLFLLLMKKSVCSEPQVLTVPL